MEPRAPMGAQGPHGAHGPPGPLWGRPRRNPAPEPQISARSPAPWPEFLPPGPSAAPEPWPRAEIPDLGRALGLKKGWKLLKNGV